MNREVENTRLETVEVETGPDPQAAVIWLHGLGADGHDFEPIVPQLGLETPVRFVFPHAPMKPVTINNGMVMRVWYDILSLDRDSAQDEAGIRESAALLEALITREEERGIAASRLVLAGFSQGGAIALQAGLRHRERLAGIMALSSWLPLADSLDNERSEANSDTPVFIAHGLFDPMIPVSLGSQSKELLEARGYSVEWHSYPMLHAVCPEEINHIADWLKHVLT